MKLSNKIRFSIVWKLNVKLFFRLLGIFLVLDIFLFLLTTIGLFIHVEQRVAEIARNVNQTGLPSEDTGNWLKLTGFTIINETEEFQTKNSQAFNIPQRLKTLLPPETISSLRSIDTPNLAHVNTWHELKNTTYSITIQTEDDFYTIVYYPSSLLQIIITLFAIILLVELAMLLRSLATGAHMIRDTLSPIRELAETTKNLTSEGEFTPEKLEALAGKLDNITASKLDTRISLDETQSELKSLAAAINKMLDRINESYRSQVRFVSDASHELRTPISVIQGYANLLDRWGKNDEETLQESIDAIKEEAANMKTLVEQLLFLARGDNNTMTLQLESFDLSTLAEDVFRETQMIDGGHEFSADFYPVFVKADKGLIKQALRILMDNAIKYTPPGKQIRLSVTNIDGNAHLSVKDEGIGIDPESIPKIFDRFFRSDQSRARSTGGSGLGLSIAKWITERHGGHLEVLSRVDIGTKITIVLPALPVINNSEVTQEDRSST